MLNQKSRKRRPRDLRYRGQRLLQPQHAPDFRLRRSFCNQARQRRPDQSSKRSHRRGDSQRWNRMRERQQRISHRIRCKSNPIQRGLTEFFHQASQGRTLRQNPQKSGPGVNKSGLLRPERHVMPRQSPLGEQRKPGREHRERKYETEKLPQSRGQSRLVKITRVFTPGDQGQAPCVLVSRRRRLGQ